MKKLLKNLNDRSGMVGNYIASSLIKLQYVKKHVFSPKNDYATHTPQIAVRDMGLDVATALFAKVLREQEYETVIEIGSYDGSRILELKRLFPNITAYGLDISANYNDASEVAGVAFRPYSLELLAQVAKATPGKKLVLSRGTLTCFTVAQLDAFFDMVGEQNYDLALMEATTFIKATKSTRRSAISYYHPYQHLLEQRGFKTSLDHHEAIKEASLVYEAWYINWIRSAKVYFVTLCSDIGTAFSEVLTLSV